MNKFKVIAGIKLVSNCLCKIIKDMSKEDIKEFTDYSDTITDHVNQLISSDAFKRLATNENLQKLVKEFSKV